MNLPEWSQKDSRWGAKKLGNSGLTMAGYGCYCTSIAIVLSYYGKPEHPGVLCDWLNANGGFDNNGMLISSKISEKYNDITFERVDCENTAAPISKINEALAQGFPVICKVWLNKTKGYTHFMPIQSGDGNNYTVIDPLTGKPTSLNSVYGSLKPAQKITGLRIFRKTVTTPPPPPTVDYKKLYEDTEKARITLLEQFNTCKANLTLNENAVKELKKKLGELDTKFDTYREDSADKLSELTLSLTKKEEELIRLKEQIAKKMTWTDIFNLIKEKLTKE